MRLVAFADRPGLHCPCVRGSSSSSNNKNNNTSSIKSIPCSISNHHNEQVPSQSASSIAFLILCYRYAKDCNGPGQVPKLAARKPGPFLIPGALRSRANGCCPRKPTSFVALFQHSPSPMQSSSRLGGASSVVEN
jgi:hypothetical protein